MGDVRLQREARLDRWIYAWLIILVLMLAVPACAISDGGDDGARSGRAINRAASFSDVVTRTVTCVVAPTSTPALVPSVSTPDPLPVLSAIVTQPAPAPTPFPDEREIVDAVLGVEANEHWTSHLVSGSFTAPGADERLALVGNIGDDDEVRSVVVGQAEDGWQLLGASEWRGAGFDSPPSFYLRPYLLDFDADGQQEVLDRYFRLHRGATIAADALYRWDGHALVPVWRAETIFDNRLADDRDVPQPYRQNYRAGWEWVDLDGDRLDDVLLKEHVTFYQSENPSGKGDEAVLGEEAWERAFRWDGEAFRPSAPGGPAATFAYVAMGDVWLWQDRSARPLGERHVRDIRWSPDGRRLAWWSRPPTGDGSPGAVLGIYDLELGTRQRFYLPGELVALRWTPGGRLAYTLAGGSLILLDLETGEQEAISAPSPGTWSPSGGQIAYERAGTLYVYDLLAGRERALLVPPGEGEAPAPVTIVDPAWSPRGDWIACRLFAADRTSAGVGLVAPDRAEPLHSDDLVMVLKEWETSDLQFDWSPDGSRLAVLTTDAHLGQRPAALYVANVPSSRYDPAGRLRWQKVLQLDVVTRNARLAWSPAGDHVALAVEDDVWEVPVGNQRVAVAGPQPGGVDERRGLLRASDRQWLAGSGQPQPSALNEAWLRRRFSIPASEWTVLEWAPDGSGFLAGLAWPYDEHLYWFPAHGGAATLLLAEALAEARWAPRPGSDDLPQPAMALVEHTEEVPLIHFIGGDGSGATVLARGAQYNGLFQVGGERVYHEKSYTGQYGSVSFVLSDVLEGCRSPAVSPDGNRLAWLCDDGPPDGRAMVDGTAEVHFQLMVADGQGRDLREVWTHVETGPDYRDVQLMHWREDGKVLYLSRPKYGAAWAYFDYNPGILALDVDTGKVMQVGDPDGVHDGLVSSDGNWLAQSMVAEWPSTGVSVTVRSLVDGVQHAVPCADGYAVAGDFSFSPDNTWLAWREWRGEPRGASILIRAMRLPDGVPFVVYRDIEPTAPRIGGWLRNDDLVLVYPMWAGGTGTYWQGDGGAGGPALANTTGGEDVSGDGLGGHSTVVSLPGTGPGSLLSPFTFLGVLDEVPY